MTSLRFGIAELALNTILQGLSEILSTAPCTGSCVIVLFFQPLGYVVCFALGSCGSEHMQG